MSTSEALRVAREQAGLTQRAAAMRLGCDEATLCRYERGRLRPPEEILVAAVRVYRNPLPLLALWEEQLARMKAALGGGVAA